MAIPASAWLGEVMKITGTLIAVALLLSSLAQAQDNRVPDSRAPDNRAPSVESVHYGWADVLRVDPVYEDTRGSGSTNVQPLTGLGESAESTALCNSIVATSPSTSFRSR